MPVDQPTVFVLGGVNGAGKTTSSRRLLAEQLAVTTFVNADEIARGLCAFAPETVAISAGRILLQRLKELAAERSGFAFETTLAGRTYGLFLKDLRGLGYAIEIHYFWLRSSDLAVDRGTADAWYVYDNSDALPNLIAAGSGFESAVVGDQDAWSLFQRTVNDA